MIELTQDNYYSDEAKKDYMSYSQFKEFLNCEAMGLAEVEGRYQKPKTKGLLQGSYIDAYFSHEMESFIKENPDVFKKDGTLKSDYSAIDDIIKSIEADVPFHDNFYTGKPQVILTGTIGGVPYQGKIDFLYDNKIVDMKCMASVDPIWDDSEHRRKPFYAYYGYDIQAAIYRELVRQNTGDVLPYYLAVATKESPSKHLAYYFRPEVLDSALALVEKLSPRFQSLKNHEDEPDECGRCDYYFTNHKFDFGDIIEIGKENM